MEEVINKTPETEKMFSEIKPEQGIVVIDSIIINKDGIEIKYCIYFKREHYIQFRNEYNNTIRMSSFKWKNDIEVSDIVYYLQERFKKNIIYINNGSNDIRLSSISKAIEDSKNAKKADLDYFKKLITYDRTGMNLKNPFKILAQIFNHKWYKKVRAAADRAEQNGIATVIEDGGKLKSQKTIWSPEEAYREGIKCYTMQPTAEVPTTSRENLEKNGINARKNDILK